jgi:hypothetical protein
MDHRQELRAALKLLAHKMPEAQAWLRIGAVHCNPATAAAYETLTGCVRMMRAEHKRLAELIELDAGHP